MVIDTECTAAVVYEQPKWQHKFSLYTVTDSILLFTMTSQYETSKLQQSHEMFLLNMACFLLKFHNLFMFDGFKVYRVSQNIKCICILQASHFYLVPKTHTNKFYIQRQCTYILWIKASRQKSTIILTWCWIVKYNTIHRI